MYISSDNTGIRLVLCSRYGTMTMVYIYFVYLQCAMFVCVCNLNGVGRAVEHFLNFRLPIDQPRSVVGYLVGFD